MMLQLLSLLGSLGESAEHAATSYVSIYESGSTDATPVLLRALRRLLRVLGVPHRVVTGGAISRSTQRTGARHASRHSRDTHSHAHALDGDPSRVQYSSHNLQHNRARRLGGRRGRLSRGQRHLLLRWVGLGAATDDEEGGGSSTTGDDGDGDISVDRADGGGGGSSGWGWGWGSEDSGSGGVAAESVVTGAGDPRTALTGNARIRLLASLRNAALQPLSRGGAGQFASAAAAAAANCSSRGSGGGGGACGGGGMAVAAGEQAEAAEGEAGDPTHIGPGGRVIFLNDVYFCAADVRRLLSYDSADLACGLDWVKSRLWLLSEAERRGVMAAHLVARWGVQPNRAAHLAGSWLPYKIWKKLYGKSPAWWPFSFLSFYDMWVARDASGARLRNLAPYSTDPWTAARLARGQPVPAYCCWNGLAVMRAEPFLPVQPSTGTATATTGGGGGGGGAGGAGGGGVVGPLRFRAHALGECAASECSLLCDDLHARGMHRVLIDPAVRPVYDWISVEELYGGGVRGLPSGKPPAAAAAAEAAAAWERDWLPRVAAGAAKVECCGIQPGKETANFDTGCAPLDLSAPWRQVQRRIGGSGGNATAAARAASGGRP
ncbi:hypothetical protein HYH03_018595 [Edaphochlamys debaryana]|uniref:Uncharacterized protein n=1 Tax=Edaphochlamys debaryana TaxID=47281 RepID=A0A835XFQ9_9CHLO|nr:hypothetical protein HYH03_018595 [Edaphochlamys debaryana]|eukprot:KAG2482490.1 hypothetical protein HYH03_018595 [Edaphochlamys debaryana]